MHTITTQGSLVTSPNPSELSPIESAIMDVCNAMHEAVDLGRTDELNGLRLEGDALLTRYESSNAEDHPNPAWSIPNQRALVRSASGDITGAILEERNALTHADTARRNEISLGNLMDRLIRLGRYDEAVACFVDVSEVAPASLPILLTGAQALYGAGLLSEANAIFESIAQIPELNAPGGELDAYLRYEARLRDMAMDLPALADLFGAIEESDHA